MKLPKIPFLLRAKEKIRTRRTVINTTPDQDRIKRENTYMDRIRKVNPRLRHLRRRRTYGR